MNDKLTVTTVHGPACIHAWKELNMQQFQDYKAQSISDMCPELCLTCTFSYACAIPIQTVLLTYAIYLKLYRIQLNGNLLCSGHYFSHISSTESEGPHVILAAYFHHPEIAIQ